MLFDIKVFEFNRLNEDEAEILILFLNILKGNILQEELQMNLYFFYIIILLNKSSLTGF